MRADAPQDSGWFTSSYSGAASVNCVEVRLTAAAILVRDSKNRRGPQVDFDSTAWRHFLGQARTD
jgi:hypothetical protein